MGSAASNQKKQESNSSFGKIQAKTDKSWYHPGECVSGEFYFEILQDITESQLHLTFEGNEAVHFVDSSHNKGGIDKYLKNYERLIVKQESTALSWDILTTGHYVIPFTFLLPQDIPASFFQESADEYCAYIRYKLRACLKSSKSSDIELHNNINIVIREQQKLPLQAVSEEIVTSLNNCLCLSNGSNTLRAHFEKNYYYPGEAARVFVEVDNSASKITNPLLTFSLYQELTLLNGFQSKNMSSTCAYQNHRGIDAGATGAFTLAFNMPAYRGDDHTIDTREDKWPSKSNDYHIGMETNSKLITSKYYLKVSCEIKGCMITSPTIVCPIQIKYPDPIERSLELPQNWNPQEIPRINIVFTTSQAGGKVKAEKDKHKMVEAQMVSSVAPEKIKEGPIEVVVSGNSQRV